MVSVGQCGQRGLRVSWDEGLDGFSGCLTLTDRRGEMRESEHD